MKLLFFGKNQSDIDNNRDLSYRFNYFMEGMFINLRILNARYVKSH